MMATARAMVNVNRMSAISACPITSSLALADAAGISVGPQVVLTVNAR